MVLFAKVVISTLALLPFFVFIEKRLGQHWLLPQISYLCIQHLSYTNYAFFNIIPFHIIYLSDTGTRSFIRIKNQKSIENVPAQVGVAIIINGKIP